MRRGATTYERNPLDRMVFSPIGYMKSQLLISDGMRRPVFDGMH